MKRRYQCILFAALLVFLISLSPAMAVECPPEGPDAEPLYEGDHFFMGKLEENLVMSFQSREGGEDIRLTLDKQQASELLAYAVEARKAASTSLGNVQALEPFLLNTSEGQTLWVNYVCSSCQTGSSFRDFILTPTGSDGSPDITYLMKLMICQIEVMNPYTNLSTTTSNPQKLESQTIWGERFPEFLAALQSFTGQKVLTGF